MKNDKKLSGIIVPLVTPLKDHEQIDIEGTQKLIEYVIKGGVSGIFVLGTTGEGPSLSLSLKKEFIEVVCKQVNNRVPVLAGVTDTSIVNTITLAKYACQAGVYAVVLMAPYFFKVTQKDLLLYFENLLPQIPLNVMMYNIPSSTKVSLKYETLEQLSGEERIIGLKDSSGDIEYFREILRLKELRPDWSIMCGPDRIVLESMKAGGDGGVNAGAHILPEVFVRMFNKVVNGNFEKADELNKEVMELYDAVHVAKPYMACFKYMLKRMGICDDFICEPYHKIDSEAEGKIDEYVKLKNLI
jgi:4-hydroxy-tetrahydrodipicolinate synthase